MKVRLSKIMSERGLCSRREADDLIAKGLVRVDGEVVNTLGTKVDPQCKIELTSRAKNQLQSKLTIILNKPVGYVSGQPEKDYRAAVELIRPENQDPKDKGPKNVKRHGLAPAGRLDIDSKGLLVLTQDGRVAKQLIGENSPVEKEYLVWVEGEVNSAKLNQLRQGMSLDGKALKPAQVKELKPGQLQIILNEGRKRQIRRMCDLVELKVTSLKRVRIGKLRLAQLKEGHWRHLRKNEGF